MSEIKKLTNKERKFADLVVKTGNQTESAMQVYNCKDRVSAAQVGSKTSSREHVQEYIERKYETIREQLADGVEQTIAIAKNMIESDDKEDKKWAMKYLQEYQKIQGGKTGSAITHNHLHLPKRSRG